MGPLTLTFGLALGLSFTVLMLATRPAPSSKSMQQRLILIRQPVLSQKAEAADAELGKAEEHGYAARLGRFLQHYKLSNKLQVLLIQAGSSLSIGNAVLICAGAGLGSAIVVSLFLRSALLAAVALIAGIFTPYAMLKLKRARRLDAFNTALPEAIDLMARALRAGHSMSSAMELIAGQSPAPLAVEFGQVFQEQRLGLRLRDALLQMAGRVPSRDLQFLITAILIQRETGGDLTEVLDRTTHVIRERVRIEGEIRTRTAQGRLTGWILGLLPVVLLALINIVSPGYSSLLFHDPTGRKLLYTGAVLIVIGAFVIRRVVDVDV